MRLAETVESAARCPPAQSGGAARGDELNGCSTTPSSVDYGPNGSRTVGAKRKKGGAHSSLSTAGMTIMPSGGYFRNFSINGLMEATTTSHRIRTPPLRRRSLEQIYRFVRWIMERCSTMADVLPYQMFLRMTMYIHM